MQLELHRYYSSVFYQVNGHQYGIITMKYFSKYMESLPFQQFSAVKAEISYSAFYDLAVKTSI